MIASENKPNELSEEEKKRVKFKGDPKALLKELDKWERAHTSIIHQLRCNHTTLNDHLFRIKLRGDPLCNTCQRPETVKHYLTHCKKYKLQRKKMKDVMRKKKITYNNQNLIRLLDNPLAIQDLLVYIGEMKRFTGFKEYREGEQEPKARNTN
ncbi:hypothetical protein O181_117168 [Austropuccinia psidii MF-1]|uniref:Reverse transcriptase zinc-binding domain-containing protein n=1 Tax=Austropuccinia psidii MF-1 TaxID=1389203 RepID=A0A9Q3K9N7_9BASI|nr:hypothetical protein [Austropuccinia psidii MF-1]